MEQDPNIDIYSAPLTNFPKISVITPSYNQASFLEEAILSVQHQRYPNVEHIVIDGGSSDNSVDVIKKYAGSLAHWESEKDRGQAHAINKGLAMATGEIFTFLNSDDVFLPGAFNHVGFHFERDDNLNWMSGTCVKWGEGFTRLDPDPEKGKDADRADWLIGNWVVSPSTFFRKGVFDKVGLLDEDMHFGFDYKYWVRIVFAGYKLYQVGRPMMGYRYHDSSKTVTAQGKFRQDEESIRDQFLPQLTRTERAAYDSRRAIFERWRAFRDLNAIHRDQGQAAALTEFMNITRANPRLLLTRSAIGAYLRIKRNSPY